MLRASLFFKIYLAFAVVVIVILSIVVWLLRSSFDEFMARQNDAFLRGHVLLFAEALKEEILAEPGHALSAAHAERLVALAGDLKRDSDLRYTVIDPEGVVLADSHYPPEVMDRHDFRPEVQQALQQPVGSSIRVSNTLKQEIHCNAVALREGETVLGFARVAKFTAEDQAILAAMHLKSLTIILFGAAVLLLAGWFWSRKYTAGLTQLTRAAKELSLEDNADRSWVNLSKDEIGELSRALSTMNSRFRRRLELLRSERNKIVAILSSMVEGVVAIDSNERIIHWNDAAARILGFDAANVAGRSIVELTRVPKVSEVLRRALERATSSNTELSIRGSSVEHSLQLTTSPLRDGDGAVTGAVLLLHDTTELRHAERIRRDFVANVSHELKTPVAAVRGLVETILDDPEMPGSIRESFLKKVQKQVFRLSALVKDVIVLARLEGRSNDELPVQNLQETVEEAVAGVAGVAEGRVELRTSLPDELLECRGDPEALQQIISNLLSNAIRYTPPGGVVEIRLRKTSGSATIEVEDNGIGIDPALQDRIFERFFTADPARSRELGGTGLGLSIVKHATESLGGQVSLRSAPGEGSCFRVRLPLWEPQDVEVSQHEQAPDPRPGSGQI